MKLLGFSLLVEIPCILGQSTRKEDLLASVSRYCSAQQGGGSVSGTPRVGKAGPRGIPGAKGEPGIVDYDVINRTITDKFEKLNTNINATLAQFGATQERTTQCCQDIAQIEAEPKQVLSTLKRLPKEEIMNPCSGRYSGEEKGIDFEVLVDIDKSQKYSIPLMMVSGTVVADENSPWSVNARSLHFKTTPRTIEISEEAEGNRHVTGDVNVVFSDGTKAGGVLKLYLIPDDGSREWLARIDLEIRGKGEISCQMLKRTSTFFRKIKLSIDFTEKLIWPTVPLNDLADEPPVGMEDRKIDPFAAFEDAGLKLNFDPAESEKVEDPSPDSPWTKSDVFEAMTHYYDQTGSSYDDIWGMIGTIPPDKRTVGYSLGYKGRHGFGLFTGHRSLQRLEDENKAKKAEAQRRLLHHLVRECGRCLGLVYTYEKGSPRSLSWMNHSRRYDYHRGAGSFYRHFEFSFNENELAVLRHAPGKGFHQASPFDVHAAVVGAGYKITSEVADTKHASGDYDVETGDSYEDVLKKESRPMRKIALDLKVRTKYTRGKVFSFEARIKNEGKLSAVIDGDLSVEAGNLQVFITKPDGSFKAIYPFARPIYSGLNKQRVLYTLEDAEGSDRYSQQVKIGAGSDGDIFDQVGNYTIRAAYRSGRYNVTSESYPITVVDDDEDEDTKNEVLTAATLESNNAERFKKASAYLKKSKGENPEYQKSQIATTTAIMKGLGDKYGRNASMLTDDHQAGRRYMTFTVAKHPQTNYLQDTADLVQHYQTKGEKEDNHDYANLILERSKHYYIAKNAEDGKKEYNQLITDLLDRGVKYDAVRKLSKKWEKVSKPPKVGEKYSSQALQRRVNSVLTWAPTTPGNGEPDLSGIGLGMPFRNFDRSQIKKAGKIIDMLFAKYKETQDVLATINYADKLQKGREVNFHVLRWALEAFIVHSKDAKKAGIRFPEPEDIDRPALLGAAESFVMREGIPTDLWMNYWRCDADMNYHHRHWHIVYNLRGAIAKHAKNPSFNIPGWLKTQGALFGYMHEQMVARCNAERESWGLSPLVEWTYDETAMPFTAGLEFQSDPQWAMYLPRPEATWPSDIQSQFEEWEAAYDKAVKEGEVAPGRELTPNWAGHVIESSSNIYDNIYGEIHNTGHDVFGTVNLPKSKQSYMASTVTAARDPIFFRWHKRIDNLFQKTNDLFRSEIAEDAPPVTITTDDIILSTDPKPPVDFGEFKWKRVWVSKAPSDVANLKTYLGPPTKKYELDYKLGHDEFYYHLRLKRNHDSAKKEAIPLTIRIFICPKKRQSERRCWIEMDKFVCKIEDGDDTIVLTRAAIHSSVIKRNPANMADDFEKNYTKEVEGFCECGWPYSMLLPRGKKGGEEYVLFVMATDNKIDSIGVHTHCGSMSYCGSTSGEYPDKRNMGYPFSNPITANNKREAIPEIFDKITNAAYKSFTIENNIEEPSPVKAFDVWWPMVQLGVNDGTVLNEPAGGITEFIKSKLVGNFRILIDRSKAKPSKGDKILIRFQGRDSNGGSYTMRDVTISLRDGETLKSVPGQSAKVTFKGQETFAVPEYGLISDPISFRFDPAFGDYFITFKLDNPGVYLPAAGNVSQTSTYYSRNPLPPPEDWSDDIINGRFAYIQCVSGILYPLE